MKTKNKKIANSGFADWSPDLLPDLTGKRYLITGGNSGIGFEAAKMLVKAKADVVIGCRNPTKAKQAVTEISTQGSGDVSSVILDLASLESVRSASTEIHARYDKLDGLINNAGVMQPPQTTTVDGFELQLATNHLGHFLLASLLFDLVEKAAGRIVVTSSIVHKFGRIDFDNLMHKESYHPGRVYGQSKLANLMFALELDRKLKASGSSVSCIACHPGVSATELFKEEGLRKAAFNFIGQFMLQPAYNGAIPTVLAAAGVEAIPGAYYGPQSMAEMRGKVSDAKVGKSALNQEDAARLWRESEKLVNHEWKIGPS